MENLIVKFVAWYVMGFFPGFVPSGLGIYPITEMSPLERFITLVILGGSKLILSISGVSVLKWIFRLVLKLLGIKRQTSKKKLKTRNLGMWSYAILSPWIIPGGFTGHAGAVYGIYGKRSIPALCFSVLGWSLIFTIWAEVFRLLGLQIIDIQEVFHWMDFTN